jgi:hypothetical protein
VHFPVLASPVFLVVPAVRCRVLSDQA